jgi:hypothetical protein
MGQSTLLDDPDFEESSSSKYPQTLTVVSDRWTLAVKYNGMIVIGISLLEIGVLLHFLNFPPNFEP